MPAVLLNLALFVPNGSKESLESLYSAARDAFGAGIVQRWSEETVAVPEVKVDLYEEAGPGAEELEQPEPRPPRPGHLSDPSAVPGAQ